jgi:truncated hemoglobin YjbI
MNNEEWERGLNEGQRHAWLTMLQECLRNLGYKDPSYDQASWVIERERAIAALRQVCAEHGDNDWSEDLSLADVISKHLHHNAQGQG